MHIPDGYLSPSTCAGLFGIAAPFWYVALRRMKKLLHTRAVPLVSLVAAFSFVIMMFNLPLPGGTTGHAIGVGIGSIVLGPWAAMLAISTALIIQALLFGDGGITAIGANCFNMAIVGAIVAYAVYRVIAGKAALESRRRVIAAGMAGYVAINASALFAAIEFGIQPMLFHDAAGTPLYAPYPLYIAIPAMMLGHLTIAGFAEMVLTAGVVAYLQRTEPGLLRSTAPDADSNTVSWSSMRPFWLALGVLMLLTPFGLVAAGSAWGEWSARNFPDPGGVPSGLMRLSSIWTAPFPAYAPPFLKSESLGYMLSGMAGAGLVILATLLITGLIARRSHRES